MTTACTLIMHGLQMVRLLYKYSRATWTKGVSVVGVGVVVVVVVVVAKWAPYNYILFT